MAHVKNKKELLCCNNLVKYNGHIKLSWLTTVSHYLLFPLAVDMTYIGFDLYANTTSFSLFCLSPQHVTVLVAWHQAHSITPPNIESFECFPFVPEFLCVWFILWVSYFLMFEMKNAFLLTKLFVIDSMLIPVLVQILDARWNKMPAMEGYGNLLFWCYKSKRIVYSLFEELSVIPCLLSRETLFQYL